ncbi:hypothetical protein CHS0354_033771 [Potamilus streckersoni]|uniref:BHLH domain-containing protein n=1 Tax=Potamilus streckersoni TaxID=2493646 RepID=A0AAE0S2Y3_9BIVA|nr:hypothetical protein CHS0354_033771 [Potamilus streckersoni]
MATTLGFIPLQLIPTSIFNIDKLAANGTYVVVKTPTVAQQIQLNKTLKEAKEATINNNNSSKPVILRCKRRVDFAGCKLVDTQNPSVARRNERERRRVKMVNLGFETLRQHVPSGKKNKKMSKVETLRSACEYIKQLQELLSGDREDGTDTNMTDLLNNSMLQDHQAAVKDIISNMVNNNMVINNNSLVNNGSNVISAKKPLTTTTIQTTDCIQDTVTNKKNDGDYIVQMPVSPSASVPSPVASCLSNASETMSPSYSQTDAYSQTFGTQDIYTNISSKSYYQTVNYPNQGNYTESNSCTQQQVYTHTSSGSLHSPTPSMSSDASYDSFSQGEEDLLSFANWF